VPSGPLAGTWKSVAPSRPAPLPTPPSGRLTLVDVEGSLTCSFCGRSQHQWKTLIGGTNAYICDECVQLCDDIVRRRASQAETGPREGISRSWSIKSSISVTASVRAVVQPSAPDNDQEPPIVGPGIAEMLRQLTERDQAILRYRFGLDDGEIHTFDEAAQTFGLTRDRVRQIEMLAFAKLRHPMADPPPDTA
jgi:DNA-directed RNA polymerase specialized sigma24 family protein